MKNQGKVSRPGVALIAMVVLLFMACKASAITYPSLSSFLYGNTGVNAPPEKSFVPGPGFPFRILLPANFDAGKKYPIIVYLHGGGETGNDNEKQLKAGKNSANGGLALVATADPNNQADYPCIFVAPQMPVNNWYNAASVQAIKDLLTLLKTQYPNAVDDDRLYLTGLSSGGMGSWNLPPQFNPTPFACIVPICAFSIYPDTTPKLPIWNFHAVNDPIESIYRGNRRPGELGSDVIVPKLRHRVIRSSTRAMIAADMPFGRLRINIPSCCPGCSRNAAGSRNREFPASPSKAPPSRMAC